MKWVRWGGLVEDISYPGSAWERTALRAPPADWRLRLMGREAEPWEQ